MNAGSWRWMRAVLALLCGLALAGCGSAPTRPREITLAGIVVDGTRVARPDEGGLVQVNRNGAWLDAKASAVLQEGDWISTGPNAYALIRYPSGSEIYMRPNTRGRIGSFSEMVGEVFAKIRGLFAVQTTFVKAGAEGTAYSVRANQSGEYAVVVLDGTVRLSSLSNAWPSVALGPGTMASGRPQVPPRPTSVPAYEIERTHAWVDRMEKLLPAPASQASSSDVGKALAVAGLIAIIAASQSSSDDLKAPTDLTPPGTAREPARPGYCGGLTLSWKPVSGAREYQVTVEQLGTARIASAPAPIVRTASTSSLAFPARAYGMYRWHVEARDGHGKSGPASEPAHLYCPG
ncbi:FecR family protein [Piscinibacter terrae]|uniref:FecR protein domain-containing protein n=1 Tax=Piscinibacter terrae TaxID=2496871 RepID=A0A3N7HTB6_9BURK|nr:FecR family protein [Albitalea terrae]RQP24101.1 hypothetical protein DZC73_12275 [Albitalea terrae]